MGIYRWYSAALLIFGLAFNASAETVVTVARKSVEELVKNVTPVLNENPLGYSQAYDSEFQYKQQSYSVPVKQSVKIPTPAIKDAVKGALKDGIKGGLKANAAGVAANAAVAAAVAAAGWVIDEAGKPVKPSSDSSQSGPSGTGKWTCDTSCDGKEFSTAQAACDAAYKGSGIYGDTSIKYNGASMRSPYLARCLADFGGGNEAFTSVKSSTATCADGTSPDSTTFLCPVTTNQSLSDADYDALTSVIDSGSPSFKSDLIKQSCEGSIAPLRCYQALQDAAIFLNSGPSSIPGPSSSSTTNHKNADGSVSQTTTDKSTDFKLGYNSDGFTVNPETTTTTKNPDGSVTETKEKEDSSSVTAPKPEEKEEDPLDQDYTFTNPDMPKVPSFYEQKYPDGLKSVWDDNKSRFDNSSFISFMKSFVPSFSGSCPTWGLPMNIMAQASYGYVTFANICYVFDFVKVVIIATAVFTARKIMFGG